GARGRLTPAPREGKLPGAEIEEGAGPRGAPGWENKPMTSDDGRRAIGTPIADDDARGAPLTDDWSAQGLWTHASKNRRSADSRSSPTTMPTFFQPRRDSVKRRNVAASKPTRSDKSAARVIMPPGEAPSERRPTRSGVPTMT